MAKWSLDLDRMTKYAVESTWRKKSKFPHQLQWKHVKKIKQTEKKLKEEDCKNNIDLNHCSKQFALTVYEFFCEYFRLNCGIQGRVTGWMEELELNP